ncbi:MAG TPA: protein-L-isoaspartate(D-aspartate) O-methyltransferase [Thermoanaerobaculia bacterium]|nr:protein-L-isoaspartate(D-aspartate) O-methyltransferase [Thermoanaerobaculia bacterium]
MKSQQENGAQKEEREFIQSRLGMVEKFVAGRGVTDPRVLEAMRAVPRHLFVPHYLASKAYGQSALSIGSNQTISQPYIVGRMIELLALTGKEKVLEVGTGTGYQAAVLSRVAARVFSIERVNDLAMTAVQLIRKLGINNVSIKVFDGTYGWSDQAPFDRIIIAAAAPEIPEPLLQQLSRTGKMVLPIGPPGKQRLARVGRVGTSLQIEDCGTADFVPLVGRFGWKE